MERLAIVILLGLAVGSLYALTGQGLVLIYRGSGVVNFAQGAFAMLGAFLYYRATGKWGWPTALAWVVALGVPAAIGALTHLLIMSRLQRASPLARLVATLGLFFLLIAIAQQVWGEVSEPVRSPLPRKVLQPFGRGSAISTDRLLLIALAIVVTAVLAVVFRSTRFGRATEAVAENPLAASLLGLSPDVIASINWALGTALAALTGILIAPILLLDVIALSYIALRAMAAALLGGFRSFWITLGGGFAIGILESVFSQYIEHEGIFKPITDESGLLFGTFTATSVSRSVAFLAIVVVLVVGGRSLPVRGELLDRLPALGTGQIRWRWLGLSVVIAVALLLTVPNNWASALYVSMAAAIVCLSVVVVTGYVGQLSLAQWGIAGIGAWVAARLDAAAGLPFLVALAAGVLITVPIGVLLAVPALRTRGVNLAVLTLGLSVVLSELILTNGALTGGFFGTTISPPSFFGVSIDGYDHPERYGLFVLFCLTVSAIAVANLRRGASGRQMIAVRGNERAAASLGINVYTTKVFAFAIAGALAALGGALLAMSQKVVNFAGFNALGSISIVVYAVLGGVGYVLGALIAGQFVLGGIGDRIVRELGASGRVLGLIAGALLLVVLLGNPNGIAHENVRLIHRLRQRRSARQPESAAEPPAAGEGLAPQMWSRGVALEAAHLTVRFGEVTALDDLTIRVEPGEVHGLIGPNGAGKTTAIDAITGFVRPDRGARITVGDSRIDGWSPARRAAAGIGRTFQSLELFDDLSVRDNLRAAADVRSPWSFLTDLVRPKQTALSPVAWAAVREFGLAEHLDRLPEELPYGSRRLVAIARAVAARPSVLLLDEPAAGLSSVESEELGRLIVRMAKEWNIAVLVVEHDVALVMSTCDVITVLDFGRTIARGAPAEISADPAVVAAYLGVAEPV